MANKNNIDLSGFDFGFSIVDEDELSAVTSVKAEVEAATDTSKAWKAQADAIYEAVIPLLNNLQANEDKEYIYWPNRSVKIDSFKLKLQQLLND